MTGSETHTITDAMVAEGGEVHRAILITLRGRHIGKRIGLEPENQRIVIGRDESNDIALNDDSVSREHCEITYVESGWFLSDLGSTNGTYLRGHAIDSAPLRDGDLIKVGATIFKFLSTNNIEAAYHEEIYRLTIMDGLTQVHNRRYLEEFIEREMSRSKRHSRPMSIILFDIDGFKSINTQFGHLSGDYVLRTIAEKLNRRIRREELLARYGGDEFIVVLPETLLDDAIRFAQIIRESIEVTPFAFDGWQIPVTISVGVGQYHESMTEISELIGAADAALYRAKDGGRNKVSD